MANDRFLCVFSVLPEPGQGPSEKTMDAGYLHITAYGYGNKGSKVKAQFYFPTDPGYRDTVSLFNDIYAIGIVGEN
ncbi:hypothetical protein EON65_33785 [archaeon]|nr:MAG: hypothetical protein EON65_33785 [archaeon]